MVIIMTWLESISFTFKSLGIAIIIMATGGLIIGNIGRFILEIFT